MLVGFVTSADGTATSVTVNILGTNDAAVILGDVIGAVVEAGSDNNGGTPVATGTLAASDVDNAPDSFQAVVAATAGDNGYGSYTMAADGSWAYTLDNANAAVEALDAGDTLTDFFTVLTVDGTAQQVAVTINGAADVPVNQAPVAMDDVVDSVVGSGDAAIITFETYYLGSNNLTGGSAVSTDEGFWFTDNGAGPYQQGNSVGGPNVSNGDWGADYSNALYSYGYEFDAYDTSTFALPIVMTRVDGEDFALTSANITSYNLGGNPEAAFHATVTGYLDGQQVAQQSFDVPDANYAEIVNNVVALTDSGFSEVDRVVYSLTAENNDYIDGFEQYQFAYQWIDNIHTGAAISRPTEGRVLTGIDVLANDTDDGPQGDLSIAQFSAISALGAAVTLNPDGTLNYDPTAVATINALGAGQSLVDTFTYVAQDAFGALSNTATVTLDVQGVNDTPVAHDDVLSPVQSLTNEDTSVQIASATLLANDTDVDNGHVLHVGAVAATSALGAALTIDGNGMVTYDPTVSSILAALGENQFANDSFVYTAVDEYGASSQATASLRITGVDDAAVLSSAVANLTETDSAADLSAGGALTISDVDSVATFVAQAGTVGSYGTFAIDAAGVWSYVATSAHNEFVVGQTYSDSFAVTSADGTSTSVTINMLGTDEGSTGNHAPTVTGSLDGGTYYVHAYSDPGGDGDFPSDYWQNPDAPPPVAINALANATDADHDPLFVADYSVTAGDYLGLFVNYSSYGMEQVRASSAISFDAGNNSFTLDVQDLPFRGLLAGESAIVTLGYNVSDGQATTPGSISWTLVATEDFSLSGLLVP